MRILLDENLPAERVHQRVGHVAITVAGLGWAGVTNGELLKRASGRFDAFLTMDRNLARQQVTAELSFGVVLLSARSNRLSDLEPLVPQVLQVLRSLRPGVLEQVGA